MRLRLIALSMALLMCNLYWGCGQNHTNPLKDIRAIVANSLGEDISLIGNGNPPKVSNGVATVGIAPNAILLHDDELWVLNSTSHSLDVLDVNTWSMVREYSVGEDCNPWAMALTEDDKLLVTCLMSNELLLVDPHANQVTEPTPIRSRLLMPGGTDLPDSKNLGFARPQGVVVVGQKAYVTLTNLGNDWKPAGPGLVQVIDIAAWENEKVITLPSTNAVSIHRPPSGGALLYVSCAPICTTTCAAGYYDGSGIVAIVDTKTDSYVSKVEFDGAPGRMWVDENQIAWVGDMLDGRLMRFSAKDESKLEPVVLCPADPEKGTFGMISDVASDYQGRIFAACFNEDTVHIFKSQSCSCDAITVPVGDGPQSLLVLP